MFQSLFYPMFAMVILMALVLLAMARTRIGAIKSGRVKPGYFKTYQGQAPDDVVIISRHYANLFELPLLFFVTCLVAMVMHIDGWTMIVLAWVFVVLRILHAIVHVGSNKLLPRMGIFACQWGVVLVMWILMALALNAR